MGTDWLCLSDQTGMFYLNNADVFCCQTTAVKQLLSHIFKPSSIESRNPLAVLCSRRMPGQKTLAFIDAVTRGLGTERDGWASAVLIQQGGELACRQTICGGEFPQPSPANFSCCIESGVLSAEWSQQLPGSNTVSSSRALPLNRERET